MTVSFDQLQIGAEYDRNSLADLWGYAGPEAIQRGIFTPARDPYIILFVTSLKDAHQTAYKDEIISSILIMDGENKHQNDQRLVLARDKSEEIHLFFREQTRMPFTYYGELSLIDYELKTNQPSRFVFQIVDR